MRPWLQPDMLAHARLLASSYRRLLGQELLPDCEDDAEFATRLFELPIVIVSHGSEDDPILNYGNQTTLKLWKMDWETLTRTPSRHTAEPVHRDERARMLDAVTRQGYIDDYAGIRIASDGSRFRIDRATVWNLVDETGQLRGQAATFAKWQPLFG
jgi:hypothetical protein